MKRRTQNTQRRYILHYKSLIFVVTLLFSSIASATSVTAIALFKDRAMLSIDGAKAKIIKAGATYKEVTLVSSSTSEAVIEIGGERKRLRLNSTAKLSTPLGGTRSSLPSSVTLYENENGFFETNAQVNGRVIKFLVDTGANIVVLNSFDADRLGIEYQQGRRTFASTASGRAPMYAIVLDEISIGGISLKNINTGVIEGGFPESPLLGMSFLRGLDMTRSGGTMLLREK